MTPQFDKHGKRSRWSWPQPLPITASRGLLLGLVLLLALSPLLTLGPGGPSAPSVAVAASKSKNKEAKQASTTQAAACQIKKSRTSWKLQANCTITTTIEIPRGVTFDGNGKTITMTGPVSNYFRSLPDNWSVSAGVLANGGTANVKDLKILGSGLTGTCQVNGVGTPEGVSFINTAGAIDNVVVTDVRIDGTSTCGVGISAVATGGQRVIVKDVTISGSGSRGIWGLSRSGTTGLTLNVDTAIVTVGSASGDFGGSGISYGVGPAFGTIKDATIDLQDEQTTGIVFVTSPGTSSPRRLSLENVSITGIGSTGIFATSPSTGSIVDLSNVDIELRGDPNAFSTYGMFANGVFDIRISDSSVSGASAFALYFEGAGAKASIEDTLIESSFVGIEAAFRSTVSIVDSTIRNVFWGVSVDEGSTFDVEDTTIRGRGPGPDQTNGIAYFAPVTKGSVNDVAISGFSDTSPDTISCGILIQSGAGSVEVDDVGFPPPGNEQNICDEQNTPSNQQLTAASSDITDAAGPPAANTPVSPVAAGTSATAPVETTATVNPATGSDVVAQPAPERAKEQDGKKGKNKHKSGKGKPKPKAEAKNHGKHRGNGRR
jgi:hypothetical protein